MYRGRTIYRSYAVIDLGAEKEIIGGLGWHILHFFDKSEALDGVLFGMGTQVLPLVDEVVTLSDTDGRTVLLGIGEAAYERHTTQYKYL